MRPQPIVPCLWFDDQAEQAAEFYTSIFRAGRMAAISRYPESVATPSSRPPGSVLTVEFEIAGQRFIALNGWPIFKLNPSVSFFAHLDSEEETNALFSRLADGGKVLMPLAEYPWSKSYGWVEDRFSVSWQVILEHRSEPGACIVPCLMFSDAVHGKAEEAIFHYTKLFASSSVQRIERYSKVEGPEGTIKHGRFVLFGQEMIAMDSHVSHGFSFNEGICFQVMCEDQGEVDCFWEALSEGGAPGPCGWLKDRFGLSWQIVPEKMIEWILSHDATAKDRAFKAMLSMSKLDIAALEAAFKGV